MLPVLINAEVPWMYGYKGENPVGNSKQANFTLRTADS